MSSNLDRITVSRKSGLERFRDGAKELDFDLLNFWQWSASDLVCNSMRGIVAEYLVARALGVGLEGIRDGWAAYDLLTDEGVKVEVKSSAFLQVWYQARPSRISFSVPKTHKWEPSTNQLSAERVRQADVYVFALLAHQDKTSIDPLDISQWTFYVLPTSVLDARTRSQHSIALATLHNLCQRSVSFHELRAAVEQAARQQGDPSNPPIERTEPAASRPARRSSA